MATVIPSIAGRLPRTTPIRRLAIGWVMMVPIIFLAFDGSISLEHSNSTAGGNSLSGLASTGGSGGALGYVWAAIAYSVALWLVLKNAGRIVSLALQMKMVVLLA